MVLNENSEPAKASMVSCAVMRLSLPLDPARPASLSSANPSAKYILRCRYQIVLFCRPDMVQTMQKDIINTHQGPATHLRGIMPFRKSPSSVRSGYNVQRASHDLALGLSDKAIYHMSTNCYARVLLLSSGVPVKIGHLQGAMSARARQGGFSSGQAIGLHMKPVVCGTAGDNGHDTKVLGGLYGEARA